MLDDVSDQRSSEPPGLPLFRAAAVEAQTSQMLGEVIIVRPIPLRIGAWGAVLLLTVVVLLGFLGTYTNRTTVYGQIAPDKGVIRVFSPVAGYVIRANVSEGRHVKKGDVLFVLSLDKLTPSGETQAAISSDLSKSLALLNEEIAGGQQLGQLDRQGLATKVANYRRQILQLTEMIHLQELRVDVSQQMADRYSKLLALQYVSESEVQAKEAELLDQKSRLASLQESRISSEQELETAVGELKDLPIKAGASIADLKRLYHSANLQLHESEGQRQLFISSPVDGEITAITAVAGQILDPTHPIATIIPENVTLQAELFATSKDIGFVKVGDQVRLRYEAFPYQKFGVATGHVVSISRTALSQMQLSELGELLLQRAQPTDRGTPLYRIVVSLDSQSVATYGKRKALEPNMILDADIMLDTRRLYEWVLDPLFAAGGKT